jgi:glyoxylase-like metal-dependent hydrolase (beta-lactamase superfamily II)
MRVLDVVHLGRERVIGCWEVDGVLVDPGPESSMQTLLERAGEGFEPRAVLLTHIHFDHAGASGALVRRWPDLPVYVHERGARHLADPERLVSSATRLYGEDGMRELWGEVVPVPEANMHILSGGETVLDSFRVEYTPGHASHHVSYLHEPSGMAFVGDVAGVRIPPCDFVVAPTPPPDVDIEAWERSLDVLEGWSPSALGLTHFGQVDDVAPHLQRLRTSLHESARLAGAHGEDAFIAGLQQRIDDLTGDLAPAYSVAAPPDHLYLGLERWHRKRAEAAARG